MNDEMPLEAGYATKITSAYRLVAERRRKGYTFGTYAIVLDTTSQFYVNGQPEGEPVSGSKPVAVRLTAAQAGDLAASIIEAVGEKEGQ